jgi:predicted alpha/beta-hydrolase family hydrolase
MKPFERESVRGWLHEPEAPAGKSLVITHGAGSDCNSPLLVAMAVTFAAAGFHVLRCDLPYRQERPTGPPLRSAERDRKGLHRAVEAMREIVSGPLILGGHSYGGRQSSILAAEDPSVADMLLLLAYPLHPPRQPAQLRPQHFEALRTPVLFLHGTRDAFGTIEEMQAALALIPARHRLVPFEKTGHEWNAAMAPAILREALCFAIA